MRALIVVDIQNDFCPGGSLAVKDGDQIIPLVNKLMSKFELVVATQDWHPNDHKSMAANNNKKPGEIIMLHGIEQILWPHHCIQNTNGAAFHRDLDQSKFHKVIQKGMNPEVDSYSGFLDNDYQSPTGLDDYLQEKNVDEVYITGLATDYCVKYTAIDAIDHGYTTYVIKDACRGIDLNPGDIQQSYDDMNAKGVILISSADVLGENP